MSHLHLKSELADAGLKATPQRMVVLEVLRKSRVHPTAEEIYKEIHKKFPTLAMGTLYSTLDVFVQKGLVHKVLSENGSMRYDGNVDEHHHLYCSRTGTMMDYEDEELKEMILEHLKKRSINDFEIENIQLRINGSFKKT